MTRCVTGMSIVVEEGTIHAASYGISLRIEMVSVCTGLLGDGSCGHLGGHKTSNLIPLPLDKRDY